jgi:malate synthase
MAAQIPIKDDPEASRAALDKVRADKLREVGDGHDGTWVAHPGLVAVAREVFDTHMTTPNQDAATAEISRTQVWQWIHHRATLDDGRPLTVERFRSVLSQEMDGLARSVGQSRFDAGRFREAGTLFDRMSTSAAFEEFLTLPAYDSLP